MPSIRPSSSGRTTRRDLLKTTLIGAAGSLILPAFIPRSFLFGAEPPPSRRITVAQIGVGRMGSADMGGVMSSNLCRMVAVCDLDRIRLDLAKQKVEEHYKKQGEASVEVKTYHDYHDVLARPDIDAVVISLPDHWHALVAVEAVLAGKDVYVQKPMTYNIAESIALVTATRAKKRILQVGSQQRTMSSFRSASELVRNGAIGKISTVKIGVGRDKPSGKKPTPQTVPETLDFDRWLGPAPEQPYMEGRVHPQKGYGRPGWITTEDFGLGMITNWGAHHMDITQWALGMELSAPTKIEAHGDFMMNDLWTVHGAYHIDMRYANGIQVIMDDHFDNGIRFEGEGGWIFCTRPGQRVTASDPMVGDNAKALQASDPRLLETHLPENAVRWMPSSNHYHNWLEHILTRTDPLAPVDQGACSLEACAAAWIGMKLKRPLTWDPVTKSFANDAEANALRGRKSRRAEFDIETIMRKAGL